MSQPPSRFAGIHARRSSTQSIQDYTLEGSDSSDAWSAGKEEKRKSDLYRRGLIDMVIFFFFLMIFSTAVALGQSPTAPLLAEHVRDKISPVENPPAGETQLSDVHSINDWYDYMETSFVRNLYGNSTVDKAVFEDRFNNLLRAIDSTNRVVGSIFIRQSRVQKGVACASSSMFENFNSVCYPEYMEFTESTKSYGGDNRFHWVARPEYDPIVGTLAEYSGSAFEVMLGATADEAIPQIHALRDFNFVDQATRAISIDINIWNTNSRDVAVVRLLFEFAPSGVISNNLRVLVLAESDVKVFSHPDATGWYVTLAFFALLLFVLYYIIEEATELSTGGYLEYFSSPWNLMDWTNLILLIVAFGFKVSVWSSASDLEIGMQELEDPDSYTNLQGFATSIQTARMINSFNAVLIWAKCTKYIGILPYISVVVSTVGKTYKYFVSFLGLFAIMFVGFTIAYNVGFGDRIDELTTVGSTAVYLGRAFLGDIDVFPIYEDTPIFGAILILMFVIMVFFLSLNVFFAVIAAGFFTSIADDEEDDEEGKMNDYRQDMMRETWTNVKRKWSATFGLYRLMRLAGMSDVVDKWEAQAAMAKAKSDLNNPGASMKELTDMEQYKMKDDQKEQAMKSSDQVMRSVEHLAGRMLSKLQGMTLELTSEMREIGDVMQGFHSAVDNLNMRVEDLQLDQEEYLEES